LIAREHGEGWRFCVYYQQLNARETVGPVDLSCLGYKIPYPPGRGNATANTMSAKLEDSWTQKSIRRDQFHRLDQLHGRNDDDERQSLPTELGKMIYIRSRVTGDAALQMRPYFPDSKEPGTASTIAMYEELLNLCREGWSNSSGEILAVRPVTSNRGQKGGSTKIEVVVF
jgi:hypothetical protein